VVVAGFMVEVAAFMVEVAATTSAAVMAAEVI
jgi:hypothetical protein